MPAYNAEKTLEKTYNEIYQNFVDEVILVDDFSSDETKNIAKNVGVESIQQKDEVVIFQFGENRRRPVTGLCPSSWLTRRGLSQVPR